MSTTYSFKDSSIAISSPAGGNFSLAGQIGLNRMTITMTTEKTAQNVAADGNVMISAIAGDNGSVTLEIQQTSALHGFLLQLYNALVTLLNEGNVINWATTSITIRNIVDGSSHQLSGVSFGKIPPKVYEAQGQNISWELFAADIQNQTVGLGI